MAERGLNVSACAAALGVVLTHSISTTLHVADLSLEFAGLLQALDYAQLHYDTRLQLRSFVDAWETK